MLDQHAGQRQLYISCVAMPAGYPTLGIVEWGPRWLWCVARISVVVVKSVRDYSGSSRLEMCSSLLHKRCKYLLQKRCNVSFTQEMQVSSTQEMQSVLYTSVPNCLEESVALSRDVPVRQPPFTHPYRPAAPPPSPAVPVPTSWEACPSRPKLATTPTTPSLLALAPSPGSTPLQAMLASPQLPCQASIPKPGPPCPRPKCRPATQELPPSAQATHSDCKAAHSARAAAPST